MDGMMDVVVERPIIMNMNEDEAGGVSDSGSTVVNSDTNNEGGNNNTEGEKTSELVSDEKRTSGEGKSERKSRKKKERRKKEKKERAERERERGERGDRGDKKSKSEQLKLFEEENAQLRHDLDDLKLRLVYLEARDHNKELKLIHLQKELEETRSILIEKEGDCLEWEQIDREKDKTVLSLNQTIAILQRDLTVLLEEKESSHTPKKHAEKKTNRIVFSPKPQEVFEYPREEDYDSDEDITSDYEDEEEEPLEGEDTEQLEEDQEEEEEANEVIEKEVDESENVPVSFIPFPSLSGLSAVLEPVSTPVSAPIDNPLVKIFSPTIPPAQPDFSDSPILSRQSPIPESPEPKSHQPHPPSTPPPPHKANGAPPPSHPNGSNSPRKSISPSTSSSDLSIKTDHTSSTPPPTSPTQSHLTSPRDTDLPTVSVRELRNMWEPKGSANNTSASRIIKQ